jgi:hypothetical protein
MEADALAEEPGGAGARAVAVSPLHADVDGTRTKGEYAYEGTSIPQVVKLRGKLRGEDESVAGALDAVNACLYRDAIRT